VVAAGVSFWACVAMAGMVTLLGASAGLSLVAVVFAAGVWAWWRRGQGFGGGESAETVKNRKTESPPAPRESSGLLTDLTTDELCIAWRRSYVRLLRASGESARAQVVQSRRCLLDELERRDPPGFIRWLDSGALAGSDPSRYLAAGG
jgi:hypothetical protein